MEGLITRWPAVRKTLQFRSVREGKHNKYRNNVKERNKERTSERKLASIASCLGTFITVTETLRRVHHSNRANSDTILRNYAE